jgi:hypothetical protein
MARKRTITVTSPQFAALSPVMVESAGKLKHCSGDYKQTELVLRLISFYTLLETGDNC